MSNDIRQRVLRWIAISAAGAVVAGLVRVVGRRGGAHARPPASRRSDETATPAALEMAGGAMSDEGGPAPNV